MGKPTGFLEYTRQNDPSVPARERIGNFNEFHAVLDKDERRKQGARCMNCGVPFCQSALTADGVVSCCPLHSLIPEWNDELYAGNWGYALARLLKTNNFPEFTGRVCPALCEAACTCGLYGLPVTVRENELAIIEDGFANGRMAPRQVRIRTGKRVAVIGSGPSGLAAADQLNLRGHEVTVFEKADRPGGLLMYGIPNMKLDKQIVERRIRLMRDEGVVFVTGADIGRSENASAENAVSENAATENAVQIPRAEDILRDYDAVILCCGAGKPRDLSVPGRDAKGILFAVDFLTAATKSVLGSDPESVCTADESFSAKGKNVIVVGGGDTGNDCVGTCLRQGCKSLVQLEMMPQPPESRQDGNPWPQWPLILRTGYGQEEAIEIFGKDPRVYQTTVKECLADESGNLKAVRTVRLQPSKDPATGALRMKEVEGSEETLDAELLLIAAGFTGCRPYAAEAFGVSLNARGNAATSANSHFTGVEKVFAAGDMRRGQSLVVWAIAEGRDAAREADAYLMGYTNMN